VEGTETVHVHGDADVSKIVTDLQKVQKQTGSSTQQLTPSQLNQLTSAVKSATIDVYSGTDDHLLRKLAVSLSIAPPAGSGATVSNLDVNFSVTLSDVNQPQTITAPSNPKPIADLLGQLGIPGLPGVGGTGGFNLPGGSSSGGGGAAGSAAVQKCLTNAKTSADANKCLQEAS
jgi:hypothetical protein